MYFIIGIITGFILRILGDGENLPKYLVEIVTGFSIYYIINKYGIEESIPYLICVIVLILASIADIKTKIVPDKYFVIGTIFISIYRLFKTNFLYYLFSALGVFAVLTVLYFLTDEGIGGADVKIYIPIALTLGFEKSFGSLFFGAIFGIIYFIYLYIKREDIRKYQLAFLPFILLGYLTVLR